MTLSQLSLLSPLMPAPAAPTVAPTPGARRALRTLTDAERLDWLRLSRTENVGPRTFFTLLTHFGTASEALAHLSELAQQGGRQKPLIACSKAHAMKEIALIEQYGSRLIASIEPDYPALLRHTVGRPPLLTVYGNSAVWQHRPTIAIVGARNSSLNGCRFTETIARELGQEGVVIVSGLARGIDTHAHMASLETGTVAVVAGGIDHIYPPENQKLFHAIAKENGAVIAEMPFGTVPKSHFFPLRNRIISGMVYGVLVVEATPKSGSLITARTALEQNRELFAVPGSPGDPRTKGTNDLLKKGAILTTQASDILETIRPLISAPKELHYCTEPTSFDHLENVPSSLSPHSPLSDEALLKEGRIAILQHLSPSPTPINALVAATGFPVPLVMRILLELELAGRLEYVYGNQVVLSYS